MMKTPGRSIEVVLFMAALCLMSVTPLRGQMTPQAGSPRMIAMAHAERLLDAPRDELAAVLREVVAESYQGQLGFDSLLVSSEALRTALEGATLSGARPGGAAGLTMIFAHSAGERTLNVTFEAAPPHRLTGFTLQGSGGARPESDAPVQDSGPAIAAVSNELVRLLEADDYQGAIEQFAAPRLRERVGDQELTRILTELRTTLGAPGTPLGFVRAVAEEEHTWVHVTTPGGEVMRLRVFFTREAPWMLRGVDARPTPVMDVPSGGPEEWPEQIRAFVEDRVRQGTFSGAVAVGRHGSPLFAQAWGLANAETGRPVTVDTPLNLGSMNKMFTGLALGQLEAAGRVSFFDNVGQYLPDYPNETVRSEATLHQLLTHTSGIPSYWNAAYDAGRDTLVTLEGIASTFATEPLTFAPGSDWAYSNGGPVVAGRILEEVTGQDYYTYMRANVYEPAGMTHTDHFRNPDPADRTAVGYGAIRDGRPVEPNTTVLGTIGSPAGGGYASVMDLIRFAGALDEGRLLAREQLERVWSPTRLGAENSRYGYLWGSGSAAGHRWVGHNGGAPGVSADFRYFPDSGYVVVVLSNVSEGAMPVSNWIVELVSNGIEAADEGGFRHPGSGSRTPPRIQ